MAIPKRQARYSLILGKKRPWNQPLAAVFHQAEVLIERNFSLDFLMNCHRSRESATVECSLCKRN